MWLLTTLWVPKDKSPDLSNPIPHLDPYPKAKRSWDVVDEQ